MMLKNLWLSNFIIFDGRRLSDKPNKKSTYLPPTTSMMGLFTPVAPCGVRRVVSMSRLAKCWPGVFFSHTKIKAPTAASNLAVYFSNSLSTNLPENVSLRMKISGNNSLINNEKNIYVKERPFLQYCDR